MYVKIFVQSKVATIAIQQFLACNPGKSIESEKDFKEEIKIYIALYGNRFNKDHEEVYSEHLEKAVSITNKYYEL